MVSCPRAILSGTKKPVGFWILKWFLAYSIHEECSRTQRDTNLPLGKLVYAADLCIIYMYLFFFDILHMLGLFNIFKIIFNCSIMQLQIRFIIFLCSNCFKIGKWDKCWHSKENNYKYLSLKSVPIYLSSFSS